MLWRWDQVLKTHPNGMRFSCFGENGDLLATNEYFSVGGGFVVNEKTKGLSAGQVNISVIPDPDGHHIIFSVDENLFYKGVDKKKVHGARLHQAHSLVEPEHLAPGSTTNEKNIPDSASEIPNDAEYNDPPYPFDSGNSLLALTKKHNVCLSLFSLPIIIPYSMRADDDCSNCSR